MQSCGGFWALSKIPCRGRATSQRTTTARRRKHSIQPVRPYFSFPVLALLRLRRISPVQSFEDQAETLFPKCHRHGTLSKNWLTGNALRQAQATVAPSAGDQTATVCARLGLRSLLCRRDRSLGCFQLRARVSQLAESQTSRIDRRWFLRKIRPSRLI